MEIELRGKRTVVAGAGQGIGEAIALALAASGAQVVCADIDAGRAERVVAEIKSSGGTSYAHAADLTVGTHVDELRTAALDLLGGVDIVIDIIGQAMVTSILGADEELWDRNLAVNLRHNYLMTRAFASVMIEQSVRGAFVHVASISGIVGHAGNSPYSAAKAGLITLIKSAAVELAPYGIRVNGVAPGSIDTPRLRQRYPDGHQARLAQAVPLGRRGTVAEIANVAVFLASDLASYVTAQTLIVDGGATAVFPFPLVGASGPLPAGDSRAD